jgi:hypothetical protein
MEIPPHHLSPDLLRRIIEEFVTREATDYGEQEYTLDQKIAQVLRQLETGRATIVFDEGTESCSIVPRHASGAVK